MGTIFTGVGIHAYRLTALEQAMKLYLDTDGAMRLTRVATPKAMREIASEYTGVTYARSRKGLRQALADVSALRARL